MSATKNKVLTGNESRVSDLKVAGKSRRLTNGSPSYPSKRAFASLILTFSRRKAITQRSIKDTFRRLQGKYLPNSRDAKRAKQAAVEGRRTDGGRGVPVSPSQDQRRGGVRIDGWRGGRVGERREERQRGREREREEQRNRGTEASVPPVCLSRCPVAGRMRKTS